jgi:hypothetical protein
MIDPIQRAVDAALKRSSQSERLAGRLAGLCSNVTSDWTLRIARAEYSGGRRFALQNAAYLVVITIV